MRITKNYKGGLDPILMDEALVIEYLSDLSKS